MSYFVSDFISVSSGVYFSLAFSLRMFENSFSNFFGQRKIATTNFLGRVFCVTNEEKSWFQQLT